MAWLALVAQAGGAVLNAQGQKQTDLAQADQIDTQAGQDMQTANDTQAAGYQAARRMRTQGQSTSSQATASLAASGVDVNSPTANLIRTKINQNADSDALNTILGADSKATNQRIQAGFEEQAATSARAAGNQALAKSALSALAGGASGSSGWKSAAGSQASSSFVGGSSGGASLGTTGSGAPMGFD